MASDKIQSGGITIRQERSDDLLMVEGYGGGGFRLMGRRFAGGVLVLPSGVHPVVATCLDEVTSDDLAPALVADVKPELMLVGTGDGLKLLPKSLKNLLRSAGIGFDPMDSGAAARTYNVLLLEARRVSALLLPVD